MKLARSWISQEQRRRLNARGCAPNSPNASAVERTRAATLVCTGRAKQTASGGRCGDNASQGATSTSRSGELSYRTNPGPLGPISIHRDRVPRQKGASETAGKQLILRGASRQAGRQGPQPGPQISARLFQALADLIQPPDLGNNL